MGWSGGTEIFDTVVESLKSGDSHDATIALLIHALWEKDWDVENESAYWDDPKIRAIFIKLDPKLAED